MIERPIILYFAENGVLSARERREVFMLGYGDIRIRNGSVPSGGAAPEKFDGISGDCVPDEYKNHEKFRDGKEVLKEYAERVMAAFDAEEEAEYEMRKSAEDSANAEAKKPKQTEKASPAAPKPTTTPAWIPSK